MHSSICRDVNARLHPPSPYGQAKCAHDEAPCLMHFQLLAQNACEPSRNLSHSVGTTPGFLPGLFLQLLGLACQSRAPLTHISRRLVVGAQLKAELFSESLRCTRHTANRTLL